MVELKIGDYVYTEDFFYGRRDIGVVVRVNEKTYTVRLERNAWEFKIDKKTLSTKDRVFLPVPGREAFDKLFDRGAYEAEINKLRDAVKRCKCQIKEANAKLAECMSMLRKAFSGEGVSKL